MKVYIAFSDPFDENRENSDTVLGVFSTERKALDFIIQRLYSGQFYKSLPVTMLDDNARPHIEEYEVI